MAPNLSSDNSQHRTLSYMIFFCQLATWNAFSMFSPNIYHIIIFQFCILMLFAAPQLLRILSSPAFVPIASFLWMGMHAAPQSARKSFWMHAGRVFIASKPTTLFNHILHIVFWCAEKEMIGIAAQRIIAFVAHIKFAGLYPVANKICNAVRSVIAFAFESKGPVAPGHNRALPFPTFMVFSYTNSSPKADSVVDVKVRDSKITVGHMMNLLPRFRICPEPLERSRVPAVFIF